MGDTDLVVENSSPLDTRLEASASLAARTNIVGGLRLFGLATFHAATFMIGIALLAHLDGSLRQNLARIGTLRGFAAFAVLWVTTWFATRAGLRQVSVDREVPGSLILSTVVAGGWNGLYFLAAAVIPALLGSLTFGQRAGILVFLALTFPIGAVLAFTIGSIVGLVYGLVDSVLLEIAVRLVGWAELEQSYTETPTRRVVGPQRPTSP
jgi:hypothetical protein